MGLARCIMAHCLLSSVLFSLIFYHIASWHGLLIVFVPSHSEHPLLLYIPLSSDDKCFPMITQHIDDAAQIGFPYGCLRFGAD